MRSRRPRSGRPIPPAPALLSFLLVAGVLTAAGCSSATDPGPPASLVGTWDATRMVLTSRDDPEISPDLIEEGASFTLVIDDDGRYSASLEFADQSSTERGTLEVSGSTITFDPDGDDPPRDGSWSLEGDGTLVIEGETSFDFNLDGVPESADLLLELERR